MLHIARLTTVHFVVPILLLVLMPLPVRGSDAKGNYVALGFGGRVPVACGSFGNLKNRVKYPHFFTSTRGFCHGLPSLFLPVGAGRLGVAVPHAALGVAKRPRRRVPDGTGAHPPTAQAQPRAQPVYGIHPEAALRRL